MANGIMSVHSSHIVMDNKTEVAPSHTPGTSDRASDAETELVVV